MKSLDFIVKNELGIHARPAGLIVKESLKFKSSITIQKCEKKIDSKRLFSLINLGIKSGDLITFTFCGEDEAAAYEALKQLLETNL